MPISNTQEELIAAIDVNFGKLYKDLTCVPIERCYEASLPGHAKNSFMSVHNLVIYLVGWNKLVLKWIDLDAKGQEISFPEIGFQWNQLGKLAQKFYDDHKDIPFDQLLSDFKHAKERIVTFIHTQTNEQLYGKAWYKCHTMGRMLQLNTSSPYANARTRLRKWQRENGIK